MSLWMRKRHAIIVAKKKILKIFIGYILQLENDNWYVGITFRGTDRLYEHFCGLGAKWTKLHKPFAIHKVEYIGSDISSARAWEKNTTLSYMEDKGYNKVRGAGWCQIDIRQRPQELIRRLAKKLTASFLVTVRGLDPGTTCGKPYEAR